MVTFTKEIRKGKLHFLCSENSIFQPPKFQKLKRWQLKSSYILRNIMDRLSSKPDQVSCDHVIKNRRELLKLGRVGKSFFTTLQKGKLVSLKHERKQAVYF